MTRQIDQRWLDIARNNPFKYIHKVQLHDVIDFMISDEDCSALYGGYIRYEPKDKQIEDKKDE